MPDYQPPPYPPTLTNKGWQREKGTIAKMAGETGIGEALKKLEAAYNDVSWNDFRLFQNIPPVNKRKAEDVTTAFAKALKQAAKLQALDKACRAVESVAKTTMAKWAKDKLIPASSVKAVKAIEEAAKSMSYATQHGTIEKVMLKERDELLEDIRKNTEERRKFAVKALAYFERFESVSKGKTLSDYPALWKEDIRGPATYFQMLEKLYPQCATHFKAWRLYSNELKVPDSEEAMKKQITLLVNLSGQLVEMLR